MTEKNVTGKIKKETGIFNLIFRNCIGKKKENILDHCTKNYNKTKYYTISTTKVMISERNQMRCQQRVVTVSLPCSRALSPSRSRLSFSR